MYRYGHGYGIELSTVCRTQKQCCVAGTLITVGWLVKNSLNSEIRERMDSRERGFLLDWVVGSVGWLAGWLAGWLVGWLVGWFLCWLLGYSIIAGCECRARSSRGACAMLRPARSPTRRARIRARTHARTHAIRTQHATGRVEKRERQCCGRLLLLLLLFLVLVDDFRRWCRGRQRPEKGA